MDGDARGGAALSIRNVTGQPIKFIGVGEKYDALEPFHPDRIVGRILGMGDILSLIEKAEAKLDKRKSEEFARKALSSDGFSLEDFRDQLRQVKKLGSLQSIMGMMPKIGPFANMQQAADKVDDKQINRVEAIINSMTPYEREHHEVINGSRRKRIARGSGTSVQEVNHLLRQYAQMRKMFKSMGKPSFARRGGNEDARNVKATSGWPSPLPLQLAEKLGDVSFVSGHGFSRADKPFVYHRRRGGLQSDDPSGRAFQQPL